MSSSLVHYNFAISTLVNQSNSSAFICVYLRFINSNQYFCKKSNDFGQVVGFSYTSGYKSSEAFLWEEDVGMISLGTLGGNLSSAEDINNLGQIFGFSSKAANSQDLYAVLWEGGAMTDLNSLIPADSGWLLTEARGINNSGQIVGSGYINDQFHAFLLTPASEPVPVPEPASTWGLLAFGALGAGSVLKRKQKKHQSASRTGVSYRS